MNRAVTQLALVVVAALLGTPANPQAPRGQETVLRLDPAKTQIDFSLGATLHTVHGIFKLKSGEIRFDAATGRASGAIVVDAASGDTGNTSRDGNMHNKVLEAGRFAEIVFTPQEVTGPLAAIVARQGSEQAQVSGVLRLHGQEHPVTLAFTVRPAAGGDLELATHFSVPYIAWGLKNPSTFLLHVGDTVDVDVHSVAH